MSGPLFLPTRTTHRGTYSPSGAAPAHRARRGRPATSRATCRPRPTGGGVANRSTHWDIPRADRATARPSSRPRGCRRRRRDCSRAGARLAANAAAVGDVVRSGPIARRSPARWVWPRAPPASVVPQRAGKYKRYLRSLRGFETSSSKSHPVRAWRGRCSQRTTPTDLGCRCRWQRREHKPRGDNHDALRVLTIFGNR
jgi:hypothetical protein